MALIRSRKGAAQNMTLPLMLLAFALMAGFMYWLSITAEPTEVAIVEETTPSVADGASVAWADFAMDPESYVEQRITIPGLEVASLLGSQAFWAQLPNETPYLVKLGESLVADSTSVVSGDLGDFTGRVHLMSDSVLNAWEAAGAFTDPVNRIEAEFATSFFEAESVTMASPGGS